MKHGHACTRYLPSGRCCRLQPASLSWRCPAAGCDPTARATPPSPSLTPPRTPQPSLPWQVTSESGNCTCLPGLLWRIGRLMGPGGSMGGCSGVDFAHAVLCWTALRCMCCAVLCVLSCTYAWPGWAGAGCSAPAAVATHTQDARGPEHHVLPVRVHEPMYGCRPRAGGGAAGVHQRPHRRVGLGGDAVPARGGHAHLRPQPAGRRESLPAGWLAGCCSPRDAQSTPRGLGTRAGAGRQRAKGTEGAEGGASTAATRRSTKLSCSSWQLAARPPPWPPPMIPAALPLPCPALPCRRSRCPRSPGAARPRAPASCCGRPTWATWLPATARAPWCCTPCTCPCPTSASIRWAPSWPCRWRPLAPHASRSCCTYRPPRHEVRAPCRPGRRGCPEDGLQPEGYRLPLALQ